MTESKIEATRRLQRENRWAEATAARDQQKGVFRGEGMTRREANEAAWQWMVETFPPLTAEELSWRQTAELLAMAHFPITSSSMDADGEVPFQDVWWVFCFLLGRHDQLSKQCWSGVERVERLMLSSCETPAVAILAVLALQDPARFLNVADEKFGLAIQRLNQDGATDTSVCDELAAFQGEIPAMQERLARTGERKSVCALAPAA